MASNKELLTIRTKQYLDRYTDQDREEFSKAYRRLSAQQISNIYIELPYLLDVYLGSLLWMTKDDSNAFQYILNNLNRYNNRVLIEHAPYFSELNITETQLLEELKSTKDSRLKILTAPPTDMWKELKSFHFEYLESNKKKECADIRVTDQITYVINTWPLQLEEEGIRQLRVKFIIGIGDRNINFGVVSEPGWNMNPKHYSEFDRWFIYHFDHWTDDPECNAFKALADMKLEESHVFTQPRVSDPDTVKLLDEFTLQDYTELEKSSLMLMNLKTTFQYYRTKLVMDT